jgi:hypothetical protein
MPVVTIGNEISPSRGQAELRFARQSAATEGVGRLEHARREPGVPGKLILKMKDHSVIAISRYDHVCREAMRMPEVERRVRD